MQTCDAVSWVTGPAPAAKPTPSWLPCPGAGSGCRPSEPLSKSTAVNRTAILATGAARSPRGIFIPNRGGA